MVQPERSAWAKPKNQAPYDINISLAKAISQHTKKNVTSFALLALHDDDSVFMQTSRDVEQWKDSIFTIDAQQKLKHAHDISRTNGSLSLQNLDLVHPTRFTTGHTQDVNMQDAESGHHFTAAPLQTRSNRHAAAIKRKVDESMECVDETLDSDKESLVPATRRVERFRIDDSTKVEQYLRNRLKSMQQLAVKRIAKAWIKGICPKKQAKFPYQNKKREKTDQPDPPAVPEWWPHVSVCRFIEPDHIKRKERLDLCLYLLRLRPDPNVLKSWNKNSVEPHYTHVTYGWTNFLEELAPASILGEMREPEKKTQRRQQSMKDLYRIAMMEQEYLQGAIDGDTVVEWYPEEEKPVLTKKTKLSVASDSDTDDDSSVESTTRSTTRRNEPSTTISSASSTVHGEIVPKIEPMTNDLISANRRGVSEANMQGVFRRSTALVPKRNVAKREPVADAHANVYGANQQFIHPSHWANSGLPMNGGWTEDISPAQPFVSSQDVAFTPTSTQSFNFDGLPYSHFPGEQNYTFARPDSKPAFAPPEHGAYQHHPIGQGTQPQFADTVPNTPVLAQVHSVHGLPGQQMHNVHHVYRPNGFPVHDQPLEHAQQPYCMPAAPGTTLAYYDSHGPQQNFVHPNDTQRHHSDAGCINVGFLN